MGRRSVVLLLLILVIAAFVRIYPLDVEAVDGDELFSHRAATAPWAESYQIVRADMVHPPLFYIALKAGMGLAGQGMLGLRLASLVAGLLMVAAVFGIGWVKPVLRGPASLAALLVGLNELHIFYSQQARSYGLYGALVALFILWAFSLQEFYQRLAYWVVGGLLMSAIVHTHYFGALFIASVLLPMALSKLPLRLKVNAFAAAAFAAATFGPWMWAVYSAYLEKRKLDNVVWETLPKFVDLMHGMARMVGVVDMPRGITVGVLVGVSLMAAGVMWARPRLEGWLILLLVGAALGPMVLLYALGQPPLELRVFGQRHLLPAVAAWTLLTSMGVWAIGEKVGGRAVIVAGSVLLCALQAAPVVQYWGIPQRHPFDKVAEHVGGLQMPVYTTWQYGIGEPVNFSHKGQGRRVLPLNDVRDLPPEFAVLHRPSVAREKETLARTIGTGYERTDGTYFHTPLHAKYGTMISYFKRK